jgi:hypothetical protein
MLGQLFDALAELNVATERVVSHDYSVDEVRDQLLGLDGVLVWVNPIQDGANRAQLDDLLRKVASRGVWVSAHPDVITRMGTKEVLFHTRDLGWGTETDLYRSPQELIDRFPSRLRRNRLLVLKQARGTGGNGVWRVELEGQPARIDEALGLDASVRVRQAQPSDARYEQTTLGAFLERCTEYFVWSGSLIAQPYQHRLAEGMIRCYFVHDQVVGFCHQWPKGLLDPVLPVSAETPASPIPRQTEDADTPAYQLLRARAEAEWLPQMKDLLGIESHALPVIWDADFLYGPKTPSGEDTYILCEINISAVWPHPPQATRKIAEAAEARVLSARAARGLT